MSVRQTVVVNSREPAAPTAPRLLNMRQSALYLGCSFWTIRDYVLQGLILDIFIDSGKRRAGFSAHERGVR